MARFAAAGAASGAAAPGAGAGAGAPTAVLVHGVLGSRRNLQSFARMILDGFPSWQVLLVDLRCHGESALAAPAAAPPRPPHTVDAAAADVLALLRKRRLFPQMLIGHSFGGKVVMSMARQFGGGHGAGGGSAGNGGAGNGGASVAVLPRPVQVWSLDAPPGEARRVAGAGAAAASADCPARLIEALRELGRGPFASRADVVDALTSRGFSVPVARWMTTSLRAVDDGGGASNGSGSASASASGGGLTWAFDLDGVADLYASYEATSLWDLLRAPPQGLSVDFVRATRSNYDWGAGAEAEIASLGHRVHPLDSGHFVHAERPGALFDILAPSFGVADLHMRRAAEAAAASAAAAALSRR